MRTLTLLVFMGCAAAAQAQSPKTYTPANPPRPDEETILNARVVSVDVPGRRLTVRGVDVKADGGRDETFPVAASAAGQLTGVRPGMEILLVLRGQTIVEAKVAAKSGGEGGNFIRGASTSATGAAAGGPAARRGRKTSASPGTKSTGTPQAAVTPPPGVPQTQPAVSPQPGAAQPGTIVTGVPSATGLPVRGAVSIGAPSSPAPLGTPFPTPRPVPTPVPVGSPPSVTAPPTIVVPDVRSPAPVLVPADAPTPVPSPATTPTPSPST